METENRDADSAAGSAPAPAGIQPADSARRAPLVAAFVWIAILLLSVPLSGCPRFSALYAVYLGFTLALAAAGLLFLNAIFRLGRGRLLPAFRKLVGYALVAEYVAHSLPRVDWTNAGLIGNGQAAFLYALTLACTAAGGALFITMTTKRALVSFGVITAEEAKDAALLKSNRKARKRSVAAGILEWVDSLASAVILVLIINIFLFQIYAVPTESMVPVFLAGDRPFTAKLLAGPRLPLTEWRLPFLKQPSRGDVVTIANPRYPENRGVSLKKYLSQFIYMITFTGVNIDSKEPDGSQKSDPLVKRIVGVPGEKLMMVDDVLYARTASSPRFTPVAVDRDRYSQIDLWRLPADTRAKIDTLPVDQRTRELLSAWDARKNGSDPAALAAGFSGAWARLARALAAVPASTLAAFEANELPLAGSGFALRREEALKASPAGEKNPFSQLGASADDLSIFLAAARSATARAALREYATAGASAQAGPTSYERGSRALNLIIKTNLVERMERDAALVAGGAALQAVMSDPERTRLLSEARELYIYLNVFYDMRNFPEFPEGNAFLGPGEYFAMGDNRYNSLDFRYSTETRQRRLDPADPASVVYPSILAPFALEERYIESYAVFRLWPFSRLGAIR